MSILSMNDEVIGLQAGKHGALTFKKRVDDLFDLLDGAKRGQAWDQGQPLTNFRGLDMTAYFGFHDDDALIASHGIGDDGKPIFWPIDTGMASSDEHFALNASRYRTITPKEARSVVRAFSSYMLRCDIIAIENADENRKFIRKLEYLALINRRWVNVSVRNEWQGVIGEGVPFNEWRPTTEDFNLKANLAIGCAAHNYFQWFVEIGRDDSISFRFATTPDGIAEIFKLRDLPDGASRRAALKNWITSHWRTDHRNPEMEVYVRQHLRGAETFRWDGYFCTISPSGHDLQLNADLAVERTLMGRQAKRPKSPATVEKPRIRVKAISAPM
jgi:hypothetical protein